MYMYIPIYKQFIPIYKHTYINARTHTQPRARIHTNMNIFSHNTYFQTYRRRHTDICILTNKYAEVYVSKYILYSPSNTILISNTRVNPRATLAIKLGITKSGQTRTCQSNV